MEFEWPKSQLDFDIKKHTILMALAGSRSYGTDHPLSDFDFKGIIIPPKRYYLSPFRGFDQTQWKGTGKTGRISEIKGIEEADKEGTIFGIQKFAKLASACNPNVVEILFVDEKHIIHASPEGRRLRKNKDIFLSQRTVNN